MIEKATVLTVDNNNIAQVRLERSSACGNCSACKPDKPLTLSALNPVNAKVGDSVVVEVASVKRSVQIFVYILPIAFLLLGYALGTLIASIFKIENIEAFGALSSVLLCILYIGILTIFAKRRSKIASEIVEIDN